MNQTYELVINFHMTEACNFRCEYCYATWNDSGTNGELHRHNDQVNQLLDRLADYFLNTNPIKDALGYQSVRLNFAGGEPMLLGSRFTQAILAAKSKGFRVSTITNGFFLDQKIIEEIGESLDILGVSFDTGNFARAQRIGRIDRKGQWLAPETLIAIARQYREINPKGRLKLNTVVNAWNWMENLNQVLIAVNPDKWKVLRVLPVHDVRTAITDEQFQSFLIRHQELQGVMVPEDNQDMWQSYLMLNPFGQFYQNTSAGGGQLQSESILDTDVEPELGQVGFSVSAFASRYVNDPLLIAKGI